MNFLPDFRDQTCPATCQDPSPEHSMLGPSPPPLSVKRLRQHCLDGSSHRLYENGTYKQSRMSGSSEMAPYTPSPFPRKQSESGNSPMPTGPGSYCPNDNQSLAISVFHLLPWNICYKLWFNQTAASLWRRWVWFRG
jgi:hypothetical protein